MPVFTVHAPPPVDDERSSSPDRFVFVRDGFYVWAFVFGALWLAMRRLWLVLIGYILVTAAIAFSLAALRVGSGTQFLAFVLLAMLVGLEAASLWRWTLARRGWRQIDLVVADDRDSAERRFYDRWVGQQPNPIGFSLPIDRGAPPPSRSIPMPSSSIHGDIVGSFPRPGTMR